MSTRDDTTQGSAECAALIQWSAQPKSSRDRALATVMEAAKQERGRALRAEYLGEDKKAAREYTDEANALDALAELGRSAERADVTARPLAALRAAGFEVAEQPMAIDTRARFDHPVTGEPLYRQATPEEIERLRAGGAADVALWQEHIDGLHGDATCALSVLAVGSPTQEQRQIAVRTTQTAIDALATAASQGMKAWRVTGTPEKVRSGNGNE